MKIKNIYLYLILLIVAVSCYMLLGEQSLVMLITLNIIILGMFIFNHIKKDIFTLSSLFLINYMIYILYIPFRLINKEYKVDFFIYAMDRGLAVKILLVCGVVASLSFIIGYEYGNLFKFKKIIKFDTSKIKKILSQRNINKLVNANNFCILFVSAGIAIFIYGIYKLGGISYLFSKYQWDSKESAGIGIMTTGIQLTFAGFAMSLYEFTNKDNLKLKDFFKWPMLYVFILISAIKFIQGGRIQILMGVITLIAIYHYRVKKVPFKKALILCAIGYMLLGYVGYFRDFKTLVPKDFTTMLIYILGGSGGLEYFYDSYTIYTTMHVINVAKVSYLWGATLLDGIIFLVPRSIMPNKEATLFITKKLEELNQTTVISPVGGLNLAAQNLINGNVIFTIIFMIFLGVLIYKIEKFRYKSNSDKILVYCMMLPFLVVSLVRNPIFYTIKELLEFAIVPYIIYKIVKLGEIKEKYR